MSDSPELEAAALRAEAARARLRHTAQAVQARLQPRLLLAEAVDGARVRTGDLAVSGVDAVQRRPGILAAIGVFGFGLFVRKLVRRRRRRKLHDALRGTTAKTRRSARQDRKDR